MRKPNSQCSTCGTPLYRRPSQSQWNAFCSKECRFAKDSPHPRKSAQRSCVACGKEFKASNKASKSCSRTCANKLRYGVTYGGGRKDDLRRRELQAHNNGKYECMEMRCNWSATLDIHRFIPGCDGGKYEIGNMFFLCPNHHSLVTRRIARCEKVDDRSLKIWIDNPTVGDGTPLETG